jgi:cytolysin-activating lysine-acyltransferase
MKPTMTPEQIQSAQKELAKLPLLGPAMWLFARDPQRRFTFVADLDWRLLPPLVLDQCRLFSKQEVPWAFFTWALVSDEIDARLRSAAPLIAPHEWRSGKNAWLIDAVMPFGTDEDLLGQVVALAAPGGSVCAWLPGKSGTPELRVIAAKG